MNIIIAIDIYKYCKNRLYPAILYSDNNDNIRSNMYNYDAERTYFINYCGNWSFIRLRGRSEFYYRTKKGNESTITNKDNDISNREIDVDVDIVIILIPLSAILSGSARASLVFLGVCLLRYISPGEIRSPGDIIPSISSLSNRLIFVLLSSGGPIIRSYLSFTGYSKRRKEKKLNK